MSLLQIIGVAVGVILIVALVIVLIACREAWKEWSRPLTYEEAIEIEAQRYNENEKRNADIKQRAWELKQDELAQKNHERRIRNQQKSNGGDDGMP